MHAKDTKSLYIKENVYLRDRNAGLVERLRELNDLIMEIWRNQPEGSELKKQLEPIAIDCAKRSF